MQETGQEQEETPGAISRVEERRLKAVPRGDPSQDWLPHTAATAQDQWVIRHRILIAAAVAAALGNARILDIRPAAWTRRRAAGVRSAPAVRHRNSPVESEPDEEEATEEEAL